MYIQSLLFKPSIKLEKRQLFNDTTIIDLLQELFYIFFKCFFVLSCVGLKLYFVAPLQLFHQPPRIIVQKKRILFHVTIQQADFLPGCTKNGSGYFPTLRRFYSGKAVMRMTTEMFINILALVFTVLSAGISIGLYIANKKNDR